MDKIFVAQISLHYEERPTVIHYWTRERYSRALLERKAKPSDWYFKRVTEAAAAKIEESQTRQRLRNAYDKAIQEKYRVGPRWQNNRWFVEQVRPFV